MVFSTDREQVETGIAARPPSFDMEKNVLRENLAPPSTKPDKRINQPHNGSTLVDVERLACPKVIGLTALDKDLDPGGAMSGALESDVAAACLLRDVVDAD